MTIATYSDLLIAVGNWLQRDDITALYPDFVTLFEANANQKLRTRLQTIMRQDVCANAAIILPTDYQSMQRVTWRGSVARDLQYVEPEQLIMNYPTGSGGNPQAYTIEGQNMMIQPADNVTPIEYAYRQRIGPLASSVNWLFQKYPNLYLFGTLVEAQAYAVDPAKGEMWQNRRDEIYNDIQLLDFRSRDGMIITPHGVTP
jgi:hypothetical protein